MNCNKLTNFEIAERVKTELYQRKLSLRKCCEAFNSAYKEDIANGFPALDKDFVQRVKKNKFEVSSKRVVKLCDFLGIDVSTFNESVEPKLKREFLQIESAIQRNPSIEQQIRGLLKHIAKIANSTTLQGS
ncbi:hypothetical protein Q4489_06030 [Thalassotalea sp. 1_MG-2023]|uniref:hypothetical protein n=1 Tax=Thalassotalea sp. 1_MG-2023 TaxID=3062680 RepID=UPI0026E27245|nr:hypothetical protein [Thalassotalea sp. 1_MG-2023]MDO6426563.1 hypothetical protein [Thalassotalea sp. 1_MG-2023]